MRSSHSTDIGMELTMKLNSFKMLPESCKAFPTVNKDKCNPNWDTNPDSRDNKEEFPKNQGKNIASCLSKEWELPEVVRLLQKVIIEVAIEATDRLIALFIRYLLRTILLYKVNKIKLIVIESIMKMWPF